MRGIGVDTKVMATRTDANQRTTQHATHSSTHDSTQRDSDPLLDEQRLTKIDYMRLAGARAALRQFLRITELEAHELGIPPQQYQLLLSIKGFPGRDWANITEIAERLQIRHNAVIGLLHRAERRGWITRQVDEERQDRRVVRVQLTAEGEAQLAQMANALRHERAALNETLRTLYESGNERDDESGDAEHPL